MKSRLLASGAERTFILIVEPEEEAFEAIRRFAGAENINAASVTAIGCLCNGNPRLFRSFDAGVPGNTGHPAERGSEPARRYYP